MTVNSFHRLYNSLHATKRYFATIVPELFRTNSYYLVSRLSVQPPSPSVSLSSCAWKRTCVQHMPKFRSLVTSHMPYCHTLPTS
jgi:hypothetical protein